MGAMSRLLRRKTPSSPGITWIEVDAAEVRGRPGLVASLLDESIDGMTITGVLSDSEVSATLERLEGMDQLRTEVPFGSMVGRPLGMPNEDGDLSNDRYIAHSARCRDFYLEAFGFDPHRRMAETIEPMADGLRFVPAAEEAGPYNPGHLRWMEPGRGGLQAHVGNEFLMLHREGLKKHLFETTAVINHLSYFCVLQRPEGGGSLSVFELLEHEHSHDTDWADGERDDRFFDSVPMMSFDASPGDLMLFGGGRRWHRVEPITGARPRITYGGFCAPAHAGDTLNCWS